MCYYRRKKRCVRCYDNADSVTTTTDATAEQEEEEDGDLGDLGDMSDDTNDVASTEAKVEVTEKVAVPLFPVKLDLETKVQPVNQQTADSDLVTLRSPII